MRPAWHDEANCVGFHDVYFGEAASTRQALRICEDCPVRTDCLATALGVPMHSDFGVWGGTTAWERKRLRKETA